MALSNIFREPRREITETAVGLAAAAAVAGPLAYADYWIAATYTTNDFNFWFSLILLVPAGIAGVSVIAGVVIGGVHLLGEAVCDWLDKRGVSLRPIDRPRKIPRGIVETWRPWGLLDGCSSLPDDIWGSCYPTVAAVVTDPDGKRLRVTVGLDEAEPEVEVQREGR